MANLVARTHCRRGHEYANGNSYFDPKGKRWCRICKRVVLKRSKQKARANGTYKWDDPKRSSKWYEKNPERAKAKMREWTLRVRYGLTEESRALLLLGQDGKCKICSKDLTGKKSVIDHNHTTGKVRGILCHLCNSWLGVAKDNPAVAMRAARYLEVEGAI